MTTYNLTGINAGHFVGWDGSSLLAAGSTITLKPDWDVTTEVLHYQVTDGDTNFNGDLSQNEFGDDGDQNVTVYDANWNNLGGGRVYVEDHFELRAPDGSTIHLYTMEISGYPIGVVATAPLQPGVQYEVISSYNSGAVSYSSIADQNYDISADNTLTGMNTQSETLRGEDGNDTISGQGGDDRLSGDKGMDTVYGGAGNDTVVGGLSNDVLYGGTGDDMVLGDGELYSLETTPSGPDTTPTTLTIVNNSTGPIIVSHIDQSGTSTDYATIGEGQSLTINTFEETNWVIRDENRYFIDFIEGAANQTYTLDNTQHDTVYGGDGNDMVMGQVGHDTVYGDAGADTVWGGSGNDSVYGGTGNDTLYGGDDRDTIYIDGDDVVYGGEGGDDYDYAVLSNIGTTVTFTDNESGTFTTNGGVTSGSFSEIELVAGGTGDDVIDASATSFQTIWGGEGNNILYGGSSTDTLAAGSGSDTMYGNAGDDTILFGAGGGVVYGGAGNDYIDDNYGTQDTGTDTIYGGDGDDTIFSGLDNDVIYGGTGSDWMSGEGGDDTLYGGDAGDVMSGGEGNDRLDGGSGNDAISGGAGNDTFVVSSGTGTDTITDFDIGDDDLDGFTNDQIDVSGLVNGDGNPVTGWDVTVVDDGAGNAKLIFPSGEAIILQGVAPASIDSAPEMYKSGIPCFTVGTMILTPTGEKPVEMLRPGDLVVTRDNGPQPIIWAGAKLVTREELVAKPDLLPVKIEAGGWAGDRGLLVSPQHAISVYSGEAGGTHSLVRARHLAKLRGGKVRIAKGVRSVTYVHLMFEKHQVVYSNGIASESFYPGPWGMSALNFESIREVVSLFPDLGRLKVEDAYGPSARPVARFSDLPDVIRDLELDRR